MDNKVFAIWVLAAAFLGAIMAVPSLWLGEVLGTAILMAGAVAIVCAIISWRKNKKVTSQTE